MVRPCQRASVPVGITLVTEALASPIGIDARLGKMPRTSPAAPSTSGPNQSESGASCCAAAAGVERVQNGATPATNPAAPRHMLAVTAPATRTFPQMSGNADILRLS